MFYWLTSVSYSNELLDPAILIVFNVDPRIMQQISMILMLSIYSVVLIWASTWWIFKIITWSCCVFPISCLRVFFLFPFWYAGVLHNVRLLSRKFDLPSNSLLAPLCIVSFVPLEKLFSLKLHSTLMWILFSLCNSLIVLDAIAMWEFNESFEKSIRRSLSIILDVTLWSNAFFWISNYLNQLISNQLLFCVYL